MSPKKATALNPRTTAYEFFGPAGALFVTLAVPITTYALYFGCSERTGCLPTIVPNIIDSVGDPTWWKGLWDTQATIMYFAWYAFCVVSWKVLPGDWVEGVTLRTGGKIKYKINGASHNRYMHKDLKLFSSLLHVPIRTWVNLRGHYDFWARGIHIFL
jgi:Delta14-sterol reductase